MVERNEARSRAARFYWVLGGLALAAVLVVLTGMAMRKDINHDEHQFVAAGALIAREGLLPYVDFPYFHVPGLAYVYAVLFGVTDRLLLAARGLAVAASWLMLGLLYAAPVGLLGRRPGLRLGVGAGAVVMLLLSTQTFRYTTGWAWNHDVPVLCMMGALWLLVRLCWSSPVWGGDELTWAQSAGYGAIGLLMGSAVGMRASFALPALVFGLFLLPVGALSTRARWKPFFWFGVGSLVGLAPAWYFLLRAPAEFMFGNFDYVRLNTAHYLASGGLAPGEEWRQKWEMTRDTMVVVWRANFALVLVTLIQGIRAVMWRWRQSPGALAGVDVGGPLLFLLTLIPVALVSGYAPTPMQIQYIYLVFPLLALLNLFFLVRDPRPGLGAALLLVAALYAASQATADLRESWAAAWQPQTWVVNRVHEQGEIIRQNVGIGRVITLAPIYPLEGGAAIDPGLVSGPFGWRVADLVDPATRAEMGIVGPEEMAARMLADPPDAILVGVHGAHAALEPPLIEFAQAHGYRPQEIFGFSAQPATLWIAPSAP